MTLTTKTARRLKDIKENIAECQKKLQKSKIKESEEFWKDEILIWDYRQKEIINFKNELNEITTKDMLRMNNCQLCKARIFVTSGGCAECSNGCPNFLRPLMYADNSLKQIQEIESVEYDKG
ncbi:MAG: hypothetical protein AABY22_36795 [Nanoarchaeota archaeon]